VTLDGASVDRASVDGATVDGAPVDRVEGVETEATDSETGYWLLGSELGLLRYDSGLRWTGLLWSMPELGSSDLETSMAIMPVGTPLRVNRDIVENDVDCVGCRKAVGVRDVIFLIILLQVYILGSWVDPWSFT